MAAAAARWLAIICGGLLAVGDAWADTPAGERRVAKETSYFRPGSDTTRPAGTFAAGDRVTVVDVKTINSRRWAFVRGLDGKTEGYVLESALAPVDKTESSVKTGMPEVASPGSYPLPTDPERMNTLGLSLLSKLHQGQPEANVVVCPVGIWESLRILVSGARGTTKTDLEKLIGAAEQPVKRYTSTEFRSVNGIVKHEKLELTEEFVNYLHSNRVETYQTDFGQGSREACNEWIFKQSGKKIADFFPQEAWSADQRLLAINVAVFQGKWLNPLRPAGPEPFVGVQGNSFDVNMLAARSSYRLLKDEKLGATGVVLSYKTPDGKRADAAAILVVPDKGRTPGDVLPLLEKGGVARLLESPVVDDVEIRLPRFEFDSSIKVLDELGLSEAGKGEEQDFSGITPSTEPLNISEVRQKCWIKVNEEGTEAAAATSSGLKVSAGGPPPKHSVIADRPFLLLIGHRPTGSLLFGAIVSAPEAVETRD